MTCNCNIKEEWKEWREGLYVSNKGRIVNDNIFHKGFDPHIVKGFIRGITYPYFCIKYKHKIYPIHRLIGECFIENPDNKLFIDHIDRNKTHNCICNLRWATSRENNLNRVFTNKKGYIQKPKSGNYQLCYTINKKRKSKTYKNEVQAVLEQTIYQVLQDDYTNPSIIIPK